MFEGLSAEAAVSIVAAIRRWPVDFATGAVAAIGVGVVTRVAGASWLAAAVVACVAFPLVMRRVRAGRLAVLRRHFERDPAEAQRQAEAAWAAASPGQRAAVEMLVKKSR